MLSDNTADWLVDAFSEVAFDVLCTVLSLADADALTDSLSDLKLNESDTAIHYRCGFHLAPCLLGNRFGTLS